MGRWLKFILLILKLEYIIFILSLWAHGGVYVGPREGFFLFFLSLFVQLNWETGLLALAVAVVN